VSLSRGVVSSIFSFLTFGAEKSCSSCLSILQYTSALPSKGTVRKSQPLLLYHQWHLHQVAETRIAWMKRKSRLTRANGAQICSKMVSPKPSILVSYDNLASGKRPFYAPVSNYACAFQSLYCNSRLQQTPQDVAARVQGSGKLYW